MKAYEIDRKNLTEYDFRTMYNYYIAIAIKNFNKYEHLDDIHNADEYIDALLNFIEENEFKQYISEDLSFYESYQAFIFDDFMKDILPSSINKDQDNVFLFQVCHDSLTNIIYHNVVGKIDYMKEHGNDTLNNILACGDWDTILKETRNIICSEECIHYTENVKVHEHIDLPDFIEGELTAYLLERKYKDKLPIEYSEFMEEIAYSIYDALSIDDTQAFFLQYASEVSNTYATLIDKYGFQNVNPFKNKQEFIVLYITDFIKDKFDHQSRYNVGDILKEYDIKRLMYSLGLIKKEKSFDDIIKNAETRSGCIRNLTFPTLINSDKTL